MATIYIQLDRICARLAIADAIALTDFAKAGRLVSQYVDTEGRQPPQPLNPKGLRR